MRHQKWMIFGAGVVLLACALFIVGCGSSSHGSVRLVNGTPTQSSLDLLVDSHSKATGVTYGAASSYISVNTGSRNLQAEATGTSNIIASATVSVASKQSYTFMTLNNPGCLATPVVFTDNNSTPSAGNFNLRVINASAGLGTQDVYVVPQGAALTNPTTLTCGSASGYYSQATGQAYDVAFTAVGNPNFINFSTVVTENALAVRTLVLLDVANGSGEEAPVLVDAN
jgi:hypothetical protein